MASEQISQNEFIAQVVAEGTRQYRTQGEWINNEAVYIQLEYKEQVWRTAKLQTRTK